MLTMERKWDIQEIAPDEHVADIHTAPPLDLLM